MSGAVDRPIWTAEELEKLVELREAGMTFSEIAKDHIKRRTSIACRTAFKRVDAMTASEFANVTKNHSWTPEEIEKLAELREAGVSYNEISKIHIKGRTADACRRAYKTYVKAEGAGEVSSTDSAPKMRNVEPWLTREVNVLVQSYHDDLTYVQIAEKLAGRSPAACRYRLQKVLIPAEVKAAAGRAHEDDDEEQEDEDDHDHEKETDQTGGNPC